MFSKKQIKFVAYLIVNGKFVEKSNFIKKLNTAVKYNNFVLEHEKEIVESIRMNFEKGKIGSENGLK